MKAFLLASGYGTRLKPITDHTPKCLVHIRGVPLLDWWFLLLRAHGITEALVNTHYLHEAVHDFIEGYNKRKTGLTAREYYEPELLGSGGTVRANRGFVGDDTDFLVCYADNLTDIDLSAFIGAHKEHDGILTMALFRASRPKECGLAVLDSECRIVSFEEKPEYPRTNLANAGIYVVKTEIFDMLPTKEPLDFGRDVLPPLEGKMFGWEMRQYLIDIGTLDNYKKGEKEWSHDYHADTFKD
jgi:mannose-1-phosphate guanylyltransferase